MLVGNRGEVAVRVIRALHEQGIEAVAVYSTADRESLHVAFADRGLHRAAHRRAELGYPGIPALIAAAETTDCEAVHPGWGSSRRTRPSRKRADNDLVFIGPTADTLARMGDKSAAKREMAAAGLPLVPGTEGPATLDEARAERRGRLPRAAGAKAGGGGKDAARRRGPMVPRARLLDGGRRGRGGVRQPGASTWRKRSRRPVMSRSRCSPTPRATCSRSVNGSADPAAPPEADRGVAVDRADAEAARGDGERGRDRVRCDRLPERGTFEFLAGPDGAFYFIELNAAAGGAPGERALHGIDLVREQLRVAAGEPLELTGRAPQRGHAIELRVNADDPCRDFLPSPGRLERFRPPLGPGVRVDSSVTEDPRSRRSTTRWSRS